jgi:holo-ACP synthase CitX
LTLDSLRRQLLEARDARAAAVASLAAGLPEGDALVFLALNVPGPRKASSRLDRLFREAGTLRHAPGAPPRILQEGRDALGPWAAFAVAGDPREIKRRCVAIEESLPAGRLVDLDVFDRRGEQVDRRSLGLPPRRCLVCREAAVDCIRARRHGDDELTAAVARLLRADEGARLAGALVRGARIELELTPKPGLVDRADNGSHPDLSLDLMSRSIDLLPEYYEELLRRAASGPGDTSSRGAELAPPPPLDAKGDASPFSRPLSDEVLRQCVVAGRRAERRMLEVVGSNAHRGYIFLSGLVLLAFADPAADIAPATPAVRARIADVARRIARLQRGEGPTHGAGARRRHGVGGILGEALNGLPSIFAHGLPALERAEARFGPGDAARHAAMATLMTVVEDTTALHRCGADGLERLRADGHRILAAIDEGAGYLGLLADLNTQYRRLGLTMGGVADCLAITIAIGLAGGIRG